jgi:hypothetical protein
MTDYTPQQLQQILAEVRLNAADVRARCENAVTQWRKATGRMLHLHPLDVHADRGLEYVHGWRAAKAGKWLADDASEGYRHGLDREGRLRVFGDDYIDYSPGQIDELTVRGHLVRYLLDESGRVQSAWEIADDSCVLEAFEWQDGRVLRSTVRTWLFEDGQWDEGDFIRSYDYQYAADGRLERAVRQSATGGRKPREEVVFARPKKGLSLKGAFQAVENFLVEHIPLAVKEHKPNAPLYAILLTYCGEDITSGWPQRIYLMPEVHREGVQKDHPDEVLYRTWFTNELDDAGFDINPCDSAASGELETRVQQALQLAEQKANFNYDELRKVLCRVAMRLNALDWPAICPVSENFVVTAVDDHGENDPLVDWKASMPAAKLRRLQTLGILPKSLDRL